MMDIIMLSFKITANPTQKSCIPTRLTGYQCIKISPPAASNAISRELGAFKVGKESVSYCNFSQ